MDTVRAENPVDKAWTLIDPAETRANTIEHATARISQPTGNQLTTSKGDKVMGIRMTSLTNQASELDDIKGVSVVRIPFICGEYTTEYAEPKPTVKEQQ